MHSTAMRPRVSALGAVLDTLPAEWTVFHFVPVVAGNVVIDHLVVGPGGIFTVNSMEHGGTPRCGGADVWVGDRVMLVDGRQVPHLRDSESEAARVTNLVRERMPLLTPVQPVIALAEPVRLTVEGRPEQVKVIGADDLRGWLLRLHPVLSAGEVLEASDLIDSPGAWRPVPLQAFAE